MNKIAKVIVPIAILVGGAGVARVMVAARPTAERAAPAERATPVEVVVAQEAEGVARVSATGTVQAAREVVITPEVSGKIAWQSDALLPGGRLTEGEVFARIDARDYELSVETEKSRREQARLELQLEEGRQQTAEREWKLLGDEAGNKDLALRKPHYEAARQALASAEAGVERAELNLSRTRLRAPFNALVMTETIDVGQVVGPTSQVARLVGTDEMWVLASVPVAKLLMLEIPGHTTGIEAGSRALVHQDLGTGGAQERTGEVLRMLGELDPETRTAQLLLSVSEPLDPPNGGLPLLPGAYVEVSIEGKADAGAIEVPRAALYEGEHVWTVRDGTLARRTVEIGWRGADSVYVTAGLSAGDQVVVSPLALPVEGMSVEVVARTEDAAAEAVTEKSDG